MKKVTQTDQPNRAERREKARAATFAIENGGFREDNIDKEGFLPSGKYLIIKKGKGRHLRAAQMGVTADMIQADVANRLAQILCTLDGRQIPVEEFDELDLDDLLVVQNFFLLKLSAGLTS